jgi:hypothetical protein
VAKKKTAPKKPTVKEAAPKKPAVKKEPAEPQRVAAKAIAEAQNISQSAVSQNNKIAKNQDGSVDVFKTNDIHSALLRKERALADLRELEYKAKAGQLIEIEKAESYLATATKVVTDQLLALPDKISPLLTALTDVRQTRDLLVTELRQILSNLPSAIEANIKAA